MKKTVGSVATDLQTIAHEGHSQDCLCIKVLDSFYEIGNIKKISIQGEQPKEIFTIEAKCFNEE